MSCQNIVKQKSPKFQIFSLNAPKEKKIQQYKNFNRINMTFYKLDGAGPVKNRPSTD